MRSRRKITEDFHRKIQIRIQQRRVPARDTRKLTALRITANNVKRRERATSESERKLPERERAARERKRDWKFVSPTFFFFFFLSESVVVAGENGEHF